MGEDFGTSDQSRIRQVPEHGRVEAGSASGIEINVAALISKVKDNQVVVPRQINIFGNQIETSL